MCRKVYRAKFHHSISIGKRPKAFPSTSKNKRVIQVSCFKCFTLYIPFLSDQRWVVNYIFIPQYSTSYSRLSKILRAIRLLESSGHPSSIRNFLANCFRADDTFRRSPGRANSNELWTQSAFTRTSDRKWGLSADRSIGGCLPNARAPRTPATSAL